MNTGAETRLSGIKGVIVDLDGTMVDTAGDFHVAVNRMRADFRLAPLSIDVVTAFVGKGGENLIRRVLATDFNDAEVNARLPEAYAAYESHYLAINGDFSAVYPNVEAGLREMRQRNLRMSCVTNKPIGFARPLLSRLGLLEHFEVVYGGDSLPKKKPDPYPLQQVCRDFGLAPEQVVALGDSSNDAEAARAAGCPVLIVPYGYNHGRPVHGIDCDGIVSDIQEAARRISSL